MDVKAFGDYLKEKVVADDRGDRWAICQRCEYLKPSKRCDICGCFMKVKTKLAAAHCPINRW